MARLTQLRRPAVDGIPMPRLARHPRATLRSRIFAPLSVLVMVGVLFGCGRSDFSDFGAGEAEDMGFDVDYSRELMLDTQDVVLVELVSPALDAARLQVQDLPEGVPMEMVIESICPDGAPEIVVDATGEIPAVLVYRDAELRGVIWQ